MQMKRDFFCMVTIAFIIKLKAAVRKKEQPLLKLKIQSYLLQKELFHRSN